MTDWTLRLVTCAGLLALVGRAPAAATPEILGAALAGSVLLVICVAAAALVRRRLSPARVPA
jgi:hypothetical protein